MLPDHWGAITDSVRRTRARRRGRAEGCGVILRMVLSVLLVIRVVLTTKRRKVRGDGVEVGWNGLGAEGLQDRVERVGALVPDAIPLLRAPLELEQAGHMLGEGVP